MTEFDRVTGTVTLMSMEHLVVFSDIQAPSQLASGASGTITGYVTYQGSASQTVYVDLLDSDTGALVKRVGPWGLSNLGPIHTLEIAFTMPAKTFNWTLVLHDGSY